MKTVDTVALTGNFQGSAIDMIFASGPVVQLMLFLLLVFSLVSWTIILAKYFQIRAVKKENESFLETYSRTAKIADIMPLAKKYRSSTLAEIFRAGYAEFLKISKTGKEIPAKDTPEITTPIPELRIPDQLERAMNRTCDNETNKLEKMLSFLATTAGVCPYIGLFGTVWGMINTFQGIGIRGSATLAVVAPGISEALISTAAGLAAAIPAVIFYNHYLKAVKNISIEMDNFSSDFLNVLERLQARR